MELIDLLVKLFSGLKNKSGSDSGSGEIGKNGKIKGYEECGFIMGEGLNYPQGKKSLMVMINDDCDLILADRKTNAMGTSFNYIYADKIAIVDIVQVIGVRVDIKDNSVSYYCEIVVKSGQKYTLCFNYYKSKIDVLVNDIKREMYMVKALNKFIKSSLCIDFIPDDETIKWYNEFFEQRGLRKVFEDDGYVIDNKALDEMDEWYESQVKAWNMRITKVKEKNPLA